MSLYNSKNAQLIEDASRSIGGIANAYAVQTANRYDRQARAEYARIQAEQEQARFAQENADRIATQDNAAAKTKAKFEIPQIIARIQADDPEFAVPDGDLEGWVTSYVDQLADGQSEAYRAGYLDVAQEQLLGAGIAAQTRRTEKIRADAFSEVTGAAGEAKSVDEMRKLRDHSVNALGVKPDVADSEIGVKTLKAAADAGNAQLFGIAEEFLGGTSGEYRDVIAREKVTLETKQNQARSARHSAGFDAYTIRSTDTSVPTKDLRSDLDYLLKNDAIDPQTYRTEVQALEKRDDAILKRNQEIRLLQETEAAKKTITQQDAAIARNARLTGGLATITQDAVRTIDDPTSPTGKKTIEVSAEERRRTVFEQEFPKLQSDAERIEWSGVNNYPIPQWQSTMAAGPAGLFGAFASSPDGNYQIPANTVEGYKLWKQLDAVSPGVRNLNASAGVNTFYSRVAIAEKYITRGDPEAALRYVAKIDTDKAYAETPTLDLRKYRQKVTSAIGTAENQGEAEQVLQSIAKLYRDTGAPEKDAIEEAARDFKKTHTKIKGSWLYTGDGNLTLGEPELNRVLKHIATRYTAVYGQDEDIEPGDLTFASTGTSGVWSLYNKRANHVVINADGDVPDRVGTEKFGLYSFSDLRLIYDRLLEGDKQRKIDAILDTDARLRLPNNFAPGNPDITPTANPRPFG